MPKYNKIQWYIIIFNICLLIFGNFFVVVFISQLVPLSLPNFSNINIGHTASAEPDTRFLVKVNQNESEYESEKFNVQLGKVHEVDQGFIYEKRENSFVLIASPGKFQIDNDGLMNFLSGLALFRPNVDTPIAFGGERVVVTPDSLIFIDANNKQILVYSGSVKTQFFQAKANEKIYWAVDTFRISDFSRNEILNYSNLDLIREYIAIIGFSLPEIFKLNPPDILSVSPANNFITFRESIEIRGKVDKNAKVFINDNEVQVDEKGNFSKNVELQIGKNQFLIVAMDEYYQSSNYTLNVQRELPAEIELKNINSDRTF